MVFNDKNSQGDPVPKGYHHLTQETRCQISILKEIGKSRSSIGEILNIPRSTIGRELDRNKGLSGYNHNQAHKKAQERRSKMPHPNKKMTIPMIAVVEEKLSLQWSPVQISGWLKKHEEKHISHETIYKYVKEDKKRGGRLHKEFRHRGKKYNKRSKGTAGRGCIPGRIDIDQRPAIVEEKIRLGDWELDTIVGTGQSGVIVSMVDRASKLTKLYKLDHRTAEEVGEALINRLSPIRPFVLTLTADNGKEFANHKKVSIELEAEFYFAKPYHSWERGLNEHTNGLVRQYFPKEKRFDEISLEDIERVETLLNNRPRKILNFETPLETFRRLSEITVRVA